jgi:hypothetical protein
MPRKLWIPKEHEAQLFSEVYIDETSQNNHRFMVLGGIMFPLVYSDQFEEAMVAARSKRLRHIHSSGLMTEIGWKYVGNGDFEEYKAIVDAYFDFKGKMSGSYNDYRFHCSVLDTHIKGRRYTGGIVGEDNFNREIFFLSERIARRYPHRLFHIYPAQRSTIRPKRHLAELGSMLNGRLHNQGDTRDFPVRRLKFREVRETQALQVSDLFIGALAYRLNRHYDGANANGDKKRLADYILKRAHFLAIINSGKLKSKTWGDFHVYPRRHRSSGSLPPYTEASVAGLAGSHLTGEDSDGR